MLRARLVSAKLRATKPQGQRRARDHPSKTLQLVEFLQFSACPSYQQAKMLASCHRALTAAGKNHGFSFSLDLDIMREEH